MKDKAKIFDQPKSTILLCACIQTVFDKMLTGNLEEKSKHSMQRKVPKSWKFKFKRKKQRASSVVDRCLKVTWKEESRWSCDFQLFDVLSQ